MCVSRIQWDPGICYCSMRWVSEDNTFVAAPLDVDQGNACIGDKWIITPSWEPESVLCNSLIFHNLSYADVEFSKGITVPSMAHNLREGYHNSHL